MVHALVLDLFSSIYTQPLGNLILSLYAVTLYAIIF